MLAPIPTANETIVDRPPLRPAAILSTGEPVLDLTCCECGTRLVATDCTARNLLGWQGFSHVPASDAQPEVLLGCCPTCRTAGADRTDSEALSAVDIQFPETVDLGSWPMSGDPDQAKDGCYFFRLIRISDEEYYLEVCTVAGDRPCWPEGTAFPASLQLLQAIWAACAIPAPLPPIVETLHRLGAIPAVPPQQPYFRAMMGGGK